MLSYVWPAGCGFFNVWILYIICSYNVCELFRIKNRYSDASLRNFGERDFRQNRITCVFPRLVQSYCKSVRDWKEMYLQTSCVFLTCPQCGNGMLHGLVRARNSFVGIKPGASLTCSIQSRIPNSGHLETPEVKISISFLLRTLFAYSVKPRKKHKMTVRNPFANFSQSMQVIPRFMFEEFKKQLLQII